MRYSQKQIRQTSVVYLYDPIPLEKISLDILKAQFPRVVSFPEQDVILAEATERRLKAQIYSARLEFADDTGRDFSPADIEPIHELMRALPPLNVKGLGVNLDIRVIIPEYTTAGAYTTERFLANSQDLEKTLGAKIFHAAQRIFYGTPESYFDLRITPVEFSGEWLHLQLHNHKDIHLTDSERIRQDTTACHKETIAELARLEQIL